MDIKLTKFLPNGESQPEQFLKKNTNTSKKTVNIHIQGRFPRNGLEKPHVFNKAIFCVVASYFLVKCKTKTTSFNKLTFASTVRPL